MRIPDTSVGMRLEIRGAIPLTLHLTEGHLLGASASFIPHAVEFNGSKKGEKINVLDQSHQPNETLKSQAHQYRPVATRTGCIAGPDAQLSLPQILTTVRSRSSGPHVKGERLGPTDCTRCPRTVHVRDRSMAGKAFAHPFPHAIFKTS